MFKINAGQFLIQLASERDKDPVYKSIGENLRDANGVDQVAFVGVVNPLDPRVESPAEVRDALVRAANFIPKDQLGATGDCGFSPFGVDEKPNHASPDCARDVAFQRSPTGSRAPGWRPSSSASDRSLTATRRPTSPPERPARPPAATGRKLSFMRRFGIRIGLPVGRTSE